MHLVAFMPLRAGSQSIPHKNLKAIAGRPLYAWSLQEAVDSGCFDALYVGTDSPAIRASVEEAFAGDVTVLERAPETCTDEASTEAALLEFQARIEFDAVCLIQATSPLTRAEDFRGARQAFVEGQYDSLLSTVRSTRFFWDAAGKPLNYDPARRPRRQENAGWQMENGAFYFTRAPLLKKQTCRLGGRIGLYEMAAETAVELDEAPDWPIVEHLLLQRRAQVQSKRRIAALLVDVDGTLTDAGMYYSAEGEALKKFNTRDAHGLLRLRDSGVRLGVITAEDSPAVAARMKKLGIADYHPGVKDKLPLVKKLINDWGVAPNELAYIGDDLGDLACLAYAGLPACPADAVQEIKQQALHVCQQAGGAGAVREFCDLILQHNRALAG